jgi:hypothetical protein
MAICPPGSTLSSSSSSPSPCSTPVLTSLTQLPKQCSLHHAGLGRAGAGLAEVSQGECQQETGTVPGVPGTLSAHGSGPPTSLGHAAVPLPLLPCKVWQYKVEADCQPGTRSPRSYPGPSLICCAILGSNLTCLCLLSVTQG